MASQKKSQLVVFDFDWSMADQDTDRWIFEVLAPDIRRHMADRNKRVPEPQWTDLVAECLQKLAAPGRNVSQEDIKNALKAIPFHPAMKRGIQKLKEADTELFILSNANIFFIQTILEHQGLIDKFADIVTNPAAFNDPTNPNLLVLRRRIDPSAEHQHSCQEMAPTLIAGEELDAFLQRAGKTFDRVVYVGDGSNDFCPALRLRSQDLVLCRKYRGLEALINAELGKGDASRLKCGVFKWAGAWEVEEKFGELVKE
ncbi:hypothetical protein HYDPIDRAFT_25451 [Hydnomerulius pinastri MD-312]|nr:hypothetical protein HYDPIDRAFT_25451 [Hydnomerulius pinastri MD-312]